MKNSGIYGFMFTCFIVPVITSVVAEVATETASKAYKHIENVLYERKMKSGLKKGNVMIIDGEYCEIVISDVKGA